MVLRQLSCNSAAIFLQEVECFTVRPIKKLKPDLDLGVQEKLTDWKISDFDLGSRELGRKCICRKLG